jgi:hypothetical protein
VQNEFTENFSVENWYIVLTSHNRVKRIGFQQALQAEAPIWIERQSQ